MIKKPRLLGWCEWASLPDIGVRHLRAKIDTGAKTSSLFAIDCEEYEKEGIERVRFKVVTRRGEYVCDSKIHERRHVRSSSGHEDLRPVIVTHCVIMGCHFPLELTLADRTAMRFPMLLGRRAMKGRFVVDPTHSYLGGKPRKKKPT